MTTSFESLYAEYLPVIEGIAAEYGGKFRRYGAEGSDFSQEFAIWMMDNEAKLAETYDEIGPDEFERYLAQCLRHEAADYGLDIKGQNGGQDRHSAYWYTVGDLKTLLPSVYDPEAWLHPPKFNGENRSSRAPAEGNNWVTILADIADALRRLSIDDQMMLRDFHQHGEMNKTLAELNGVTEATMSYRHTQALKRLLAQLGGEKPKRMRPNDKYDPWRGRHSVSNARARAIQSGYYEED